MSSKTTLKECVVASGFPYDKATHPIDNIREVSTIITTNLAFDRWGEVIRDKVLVAAMVDRLTHNAYLINMNGESYRLKETRKFR